MLSFHYDSEGKLGEIGYSEAGGAETEYVVERNALGDVSALYTTGGILIGTYSYDPYGRLLEAKTAEGYNDEHGVLIKNPFRYRVYYYDNGTGWYYLNSRYYDPKTKHFINADDHSYLGTGDEINSYNLFTYCGGDPVNQRDESGNRGTYFIPLADLPFIGKIIEKNYTERTGLTREVHYNRNQYNETPLSIEEVCTIKSDGIIQAREDNGWELLSDSQSLFHRWPTENQDLFEAWNNKKFVKKNGEQSSEIIINIQKGKDPYVVTNIYNIGTWNAYDCTLDASKHKEYDVDSYFMWGN